MNLPTVLVLVLVAGAAFLAVRRLWRGRGKGCAGCPGRDACGGGCGKCKK